MDPRLRGDDDERDNKKKIDTSQVWDDNMLTYGTASQKYQKELFATAINYQLRTRERR
jgi:hypothetical protein